MLCVTVMPSQAERRAATTAAILASARALFAERGFEGASIDDIALAAGVAKGAVYHHYPSKEAVFVEVLDAVHRDVAAAEPPAALAGFTDPVELIGAAVLHYLTTVSEPATRRILLIDGPVVIGWARWREIDDRYFGAGARVAMRVLLGSAASEAEVDAATHLSMGAVMEAALVCATAADPAAEARELVGGLKRMLAGLRR
jgi:AcrR family transcriptional regulator